MCAIQGAQGSNSRRQERGRSSSGVKKPGRPPRIMTRAPQPPRSDFEPPSEGPLSKPGLMVALRLAEADSPERSRAREKHRLFPKRPRQQRDPPWPAPIANFPRRAPNPAPPNAPLLPHPRVCQMRRIHSLTRHQLCMATQILFRTHVTTGFSDPMIDHFLRGKPVGFPIRLPSPSPVRLGPPQPYPAETS